MVTKEFISYFGKSNEHFESDILQFFVQFLPIDLVRWKKQRKVDKDSVPYMRYENKDTHGDVDYFDKLILDRKTRTIIRTTSTLLNNGEKRKLLRKIISFQISSGNIDQMKPGYYLNNVIRSNETLTIPWGTIDPYEPERFLYETGLLISIQKEGNFLHIPTRAHSIGLQLIEATQNIDVSLESGLMTVIYNNGIPFTTDLTKPNDPHNLKINQAIQSVTDHLATQLRELCGVRFSPQPEELSQKLTTSAINGIRQPSFDFQPSEGIPGA